MKGTSCRADVIANSFDLALVLSGDGKLSPHIADACACASRPCEQFECIIGYRSHALEMNGLCTYYRHITEEGRAWRKLGAGVGASRPRPAESARRPDVSLVQLTFVEYISRESVSVGASGCINVYVRGGGAGAAAAAISAALLKPVNMFCRRHIHHSVPPRYGPTNGCPKAR
ncbi:hypothetical protein EVAR_32190_1 [Eumeta japonica]|uniref:Uncharacterized protein n=1 Tax=Eumeta variegata TaxID=151549 RepID=A0A4C1W0E6_EUMVA|nr:hypothetical protein EVAR_32190_1 [Eumeta japonica]